MEVLSQHVLCYYKGKSPIFTLELSQKSDFQRSTTKPDNCQNRANLALEVVLMVVLHFLKKLNKSN